MEHYDDVNVQVWQNSVAMEAYNLGQNKMEQQTSIPPKSRMKRREGQKRAIFPSLIWGEGGSRFSIYFVQDCSLVYPGSIGFFLKYLIWNKQQIDKKKISSGTQGKTCFQVKLKFFHEREASGRFFMFSAAKASERTRASRWGQLPEPEMRSEGLWESLMEAMTSLNLIRSLRIVVSAQ